MRMSNRFKRMIIAVLYVILIMAVPFTVYAKESDQKTVRVGWHEPPHFITDQYGRQSGYSYEYQRKVSAYTGWKYEYVKGTWTDLFQMLRNGEIDLMSDISYTEERANDILYTSLPMGTEAYYVFTSPNNDEISEDDISTLNGKRIGVTEGSIQKEMFVDWADKHDIDAMIIEKNCDEEELASMLGTEFDAFVTMDFYGLAEVSIPVCKIGSSDFYFAVSKSRPDLLAELDSALNMIQDENKYYDQQLHDKYLKSSETNRYLSNSEKAWLADHGTIRIGYQDNYLAFCAKSQSTGDLIGALKDYMDYASSAFENAHLDYEAVAFPTSAAAMEALKNGEIDCMFPANLTDYDSEMLGLITSPPLMRTEMDAVVRSSVQKEFLHKQQVTVAVNEGNTNYDMFLADHYPDWQRAYFKDTPAGLDAVAAGDVDCVIISNYRYSNISKQCEKLHLSTVYTGVDMDYCFAMREGDTELYSIMARLTGIVPDATVHTALTYYSTEDVKTSFSDLIKDNLFVVLLAIASILMIIMILLLRSIRAERKILEEEHLVKDLNKRVFIDALTSVRNKGAFFETTQKLQKSIDKGEQPEFAVVIFDCNNLKVINDHHGHDKGDIYLMTACNLICRVFSHSPVFRIGGDEFAVILQNDDYINRDGLIEQFKENSTAICQTAENKWEEVHMALGVATYDPGIDLSVSDVTRRADKIMYENKRNEKLR